MTQTAPMRTLPLAFGALTLLFVACFTGGGSSRWEVLSLLYLRPIAVLCLVAGLVIAVARATRIAVSAPIVLLGLFAALMLLQLVPLPPDLWVRLPGREMFENPAVIAEIGRPWRPLTMSPDHTINALLTLVFPAAVLVLYAVVEPAWRLRTVPLMVGVATLSAVLGVLQFAGGEGSPFYLFTITHHDSPVGLFANRNHHAAFLAAALPMLRFWTLMPVERGEYVRARYAIAAALALVFVAVTIATGSRAGLGLTLVGLAGAAILAPWPREAFAGRGGKAAAAAGVAAIAAVAIGMVVLGRGVAFDRLFGQDALDDARVHALPVVLDMVPRYLPFGAGFGTFDTIFRIVEPDRLLAASYYNHAHNDFIELLLDGGIPAALIGLGLLIWLGRRIIAVSRRAGDGSSVDRALGRLGATVVVILLLASIPDYPLRTPMLAAVFALACCWLGRQPVDSAPTDAR